VYPVKRKFIAHFDVAQMWDGKQVPWG
jgi:hypothetical protein